MQGKERRVVSCLQVNRSEYINDCGAISCPFKLLSPVLLKWRGEGGWDKVASSEGGGQFAMFSGGRGTNRGPLGPSLGLCGMHFIGLQQTERNTQQKCTVFLHEKHFWVWSTSLC